METVNPFNDIIIAGSDDTPSDYQNLDKVKTLQVGFGSQVLRCDRQGLWMGASKFADAPFRVDMQGNAFLNSITLSGYVPLGGALNDIGAGNITGTYIGNGAITSSKIATNAVSASTIQAGAITADKISAGSVTSDKLSVNYLSAITGNLGTIYAGTLNAVNITGSTITGTTLSTATSGQRIALFQTLMGFYNSSNQYVATVYANGKSLLLQGQMSDSNIYLDSGGGQGVIAFLAGGAGNVKALFDWTYSCFAPYNDSELDLGNEIKGWRDFYLKRKHVYKGVEIPIVHFGKVSGTSLSTTNSSSWTISNPSSGVYIVTHNLNHSNYTLSVTPFAGVVKNITVSSMTTTAFTVRISNLSDALENNDFMFSLFEKV